MKDVPLRLTVSLLTLVGSSAAVAAAAQPVSSGAPPSALPSGSGEEFRTQMLGWADRRRQAPVQSKEIIGERKGSRRLAISSPFGWRSDPIEGARRIHAGVDLPGHLGERVYATAGGTVRVAGRAGGYGNLVEIVHPGGVVTRYGHLAGIQVSPSQRVRQGQVIGNMGSTGRSTGVHLHYEVRVRGRPVDPMQFIGQTPVTYETTWAGSTAVKPHWAGWDAQSGDVLPQSLIN